MEKAGQLVSAGIAIGEDSSTRFFFTKLNDIKPEMIAEATKNAREAAKGSKVGRPMACAFCASGQGGFVRNLSAGEIVGQFLAMKKLSGRDIDNIVYMGMGEPFLNQESVFKSIKILNKSKMRGLGIRRITIPTAGIVPGILALAQAQMSVKLSVSLHAPNDRLRSNLMPINKSIL